MRRFFLILLFLFIILLNNSLIVKAYFGNPQDIQALAVDKNYVWIGLRNRAFKRFDKTRKTVKNFSLKGLPIYSDNMDVIIVSSAGKLALFNIGHEKILNEICDVFNNHMVDYCFAFEEKDKILWGVTYGENKLGSNWGHQIGVRSRILTRQNF